MVKTSSTRSLCRPDPVLGFIFVGQTWRRYDARLAHLHKGHGTLVAVSAPLVMPLQTRTFQ
jgi:hypothetical protein